MNTKDSYVSNFCPLQKPNFLFILTYFRVFHSVLDEKNSAIIIEDVEDNLQQPDNLEDVDILDFGPEGSVKFHSFLIAKYVKISLFFFQFVHI